jgi:LPXTG-motif cell wall-anchored protein
MTAIRQRWQRSAAVAATGVAALVGTGIFAAAPASAHTPVWSVDCTSVTVNLSAYNAGVNNTVSIDAGSKSLLASTVFKDSFSKKIQLPKHTSPLKVHLSVKAGDGDQYSRDETKVSPVCSGGEKPTPAPTQATPAPSHTSSQAPAPAPSKPSQSAPAQKPSGGLAETGSSSSTPLIAGIAGVVVIAGVGMVVVSRKRRSASN